MGKTLFLLAAVLGTTASLAQVKQGTIVYERKINLHRMIQDEQMRAMMPEYRRTLHILLFNDSSSLYKSVPDDETPDPFAGGAGGNRVVIRSGSDINTELYKNFTRARFVRSEELGGKNFLITDSIKQRPWKLTEETKQIAGHTCSKAVLKMPMAFSMTTRVTTSINNSAAPQRDSGYQGAKPREVEVIAWFAQDIQSPAGPENYDQLPGVILELDMDHGATVYTATEIKNAVDAKELKEPKKGKIITSAEFIKMRMEMMQNQMPGRGSFRIGG